MHVLYCVLIFFMLTGVVWGNEDGAKHRFEIYQVEFVKNVSAPLLERRASDPSYFHSSVTQEYALATAKYIGTPIVTDADIVEYCWEDQLIELEPAATARWESLGGYRVPLSGIPLLVVVDGAPCYAAMAWNPLSSQSCKLPQIWGKAHGNRIRIGGLYITAEGDTIQGASFDPRVKQLMGELGKLKEHCR
jgi:hypothetical protein